MVSTTTPSQVCSVTSSSVPPSGVTAIGVARRGFVIWRTTRSSRSNARSRPCSGSGAHDRPPRDAAGERSRNSSVRSEEHTSELQSHSDLVCRLLLEKKKKKKKSKKAQNNRDVSK